MKKRATFLEKMKERLIAKRRELTEFIRETSDANKPEETVKDTADEAISLNLSKLHSSLQEAEIDEIKMIEDALERIEKGEYGICIDCGDPISEKRLEYQPYAARCIACQEAVEG